MPKTRPPYPPEFKTEAVRLYRSSGRPLSEIANDLGCSVESLRLWVKQADIDEGRADGLKTEEREELSLLRRRVRVLEQEREILKKPRPGSPRRPARSRSGVRVREGPPGVVSHCHDDPSARCLRERVLRVVQPVSIPESASRRGAHRDDPRHPRRQPPHAWRATHPRGGPTRQRSTASGWRTSPTSRRREAFCTWRWCSTRTAARSSAGRCGRPHHGAGPRRARHGAVAAAPRFRTGAPLG